MAGVERDKMAHVRGREVRGTVARDGGGGFNLVGLSLDTDHPCSMHDRNFLACVNLATLQDSLPTTLIFEFPEDE